MKSTTNVKELQQAFLQRCCKTKMAFADHVLQEPRVDSTLSLLESKMYGHDGPTWMWTDDTNS